MRLKEKQKFDEIGMKQICQFYFSNETNTKLVVFCITKLYDLDFPSAYRCDSDAFFESHFPLVCVISVLLQLKWLNSQRLLYVTPSDPQTGE